MSTLESQIDAISTLAMQITQAVLEKNEQAKAITGDDNGALPLASALDEFYQVVSALENNRHSMSDEDYSELADYGLSLHDRLGYLVRQLEIMDRRNDIALLFASLGAWLVDRDATLDNLEGIADGFAWMVNGLTDTDELAAMCRTMDSIAESASTEKQLDEDRSNAWRPWRVLNLNTGIAATRSLDAELMDSIFEKLGRRLPYDMPGFLADGRRQMIGQNVPDEVQQVMNRYVEKWPDAPAH